VKYAVAVLNFFDNENEIKVVEANTPVAAIFLAIGQSQHDFKNVVSVEDAISEFFNQDISISVPLLLDEVVS
jgi:hypothetical protein